MPVVESRLKSGVLMLGAVDFSCQPTNVRVIPPEEPTGDDAEEVLCGDALDPEGGGDSSWRLAVNAIQDFTDPDGFVQYTWDNQGVEVPFSWKTRVDGPTYSGTVRIWPVEVGGDVNRRLSTEASFRITSGKPTRTEATVPAWAAETTYTVGQRVELSGGEVLQATVGGVSGTVEPTPPGVGSTVVDGSVTWTQQS